MGVAMRIEPEFDAAAWLAVHTGYCLRHRVSLTPAVCQSNRITSSAPKGDSRCFGCGGLDDQADPVKPAPVLTLILGGAEDRETPEALDFREEEELSDDSDDQGTGSTEITASEFALLDPLSQALLKELIIYREEEDTQDTELPEMEMVNLPDYPDTPRRVAVFTGTCARCGGYMNHAAREHGRDGIDDEVYRCLGCGWRTSPVYEENRLSGARDW